MDGIDKLYQGLSAVYDLGTPEEFRKKIADEEHRKKLYEQVSPNIDLGVADFPAFSQKIDGYLQAQPAVQQDPLDDERSRAFGQMPDPLYSGQYQYHQQVAEKEAQMQHEEQAQLPISDHDRQLQEQIRQKEIEGRWGKPNGTTFGVDKQTGMPTINQTEGDGTHLYAGEQLANQDEIDALKGQLPSYLTREVKTPQDLLVNTAEAWSSNTEMGRDFKDMLEAGTITPEEYKQAMIEANQDYINQQTRILGQKATNATIADISKTINPIIEQLQAERREAMQRAAGQGQMRGGAYGAIGAQMSANTAYDSKKDAVLSEYLQAQQYLVDAVKISEAAQKGQGFWKGLGGSLGDVDTWDMGISQLVRSANLKKIVEKYEKKPDSLTDSERALMDAAVAYMSACAYNSDKLSRLYKAGQTTGESLPFMLQFAVMPVGAIKDKVAKGILGYGIEQFGGKALQTAGKYTFGRAAAETGTALLGNMAAAGVQTAAFGAPKIAEGTISRMTGDIKPEFDENGRIVYGGRENQQGLGEALWNAGVDTYVENLSEMILTSGDPIKAFVRGTDLFKNLTKNEAIQVLTKMSEKWGESTMGKIAGRMQFRSFPEEVKEEYVGNLMRWGASTDVNSAAEAGLDADSQIDLWMGLAPTSIAFAGLGLGEYSVRGGIDRFQSSQAARKLRKIMLEGEERKYLENLLKSRDSDEFKFAAHDVVKSILRNDKLSAQEKRAYLDNLYVTYQSQLALEAEDAKIADEVKTEVQGITNKNNGYVYPVSLAGDPNTQGHIVAGYVEVDVTDPSKPRIGNDEIVTVKLNDGRVVQLSTKELDLTGTPQMAQEVFNTRAEERINAQRLIDKSNSAFHEGEEGTIQVPNPQTGELDELPSKILSVTDEGVQVEITDFAGQSTTALIPHDEALRSLRVVKPQEVQQEQPQAQETPAEQPEAAVEHTADNIVIFSNGTEEKRAIDNGDGTYTIMEKGENNEDIPFKQTEEWFANNGYAIVEQEQPEEPQASQQPIQPAAATVVPNIDTMNADEYVRATVEDKYKGNKAKAQSIIAAKLNGAKTELKAAQGEFDKFQRRGLTSSMNEEQWEAQYDQYEQKIKGLTSLVSKLEAANIAAAHYKTQAELQAEAERKEREAAMREQRRQLAEAEAAGDIEAKWQNTKKTVGFAATKTLPNGQKVNGHYILTEAGDVIPSHDPRQNYADSEGYVMENGQNVNDNNYKDPEVQKIANDIAQNYGGQAVEQMPFLENKAGRVLSGNNRTISGIIAAENNTDQAYLAALAENAQQYGFTPEQLAEYQHPRLQFVVEDELPFTTGTFAMFNQQEKKTKSSVNRAIANSKMVTEAVRDKMLEVMDQYDSLDSFFGSENAAADIVQSLISEGLMTQQEVAGLTESTGTGFKFSQSGREYVTDMLLGTLFDEQTIKMLAGEKTLKQAILRALPSIVANRRLKGYELTDSINNAIQLLYEARKANDGKSTADAFQLFLRQVDAFQGKVTDRFDGFDIILANRMSAGVEQLREMLNLYNNSARDEANGQMGFFEPRTSEDIKQDVYEYYTKQQPDLAAAINGAAEKGTQSQSPVSSGTANEGEVRQVISPEQLSELRQQAQEFSDKLGVPIVVFDNINDVPDTEKAAKEIYVKEGNNVDAWMSADGKTIYVNANSPEIQSEGGLRRKVFHEIVAHKGLRQLMGNQVFDQLCAYVWEAMPVDQRVKYYDYAQQNYPGRSENELRLIAADEYMAFNAEQFTSLDTNDQSETAKEVRSIWQKIADKLRELLDKILGDSYMSDDALAELYKISYNNLRQRVQEAKVVPERPNSKQLQGMSYTVAEAEDYIGRVVRNILDENGYNDVEIVGTKVIGSRVNGNAREDSDLDAIVEFKGDAREDSLFNLFAGENIELDGVKVDINPITEDKSGTIEQFMRRSDKYLAEKNAETEIKKAIADFKKQYPDPNVAIFFRNGKTYDIYGEDAVKAAEILGVEPTEKNEMPFVSFPAEDVGTNLRKFIAKGVKVGIASHPAHKPSKGDYQQGDKFMWEGKEAIIKGFTHFGTAIVEVDGSRRELSREQLDDILDYGDYMYHVGDVVTYNGKRAQIVDFASGDPVIQVEGEGENRYVSFSDIERVKKETPTEDNAHLSDNKSAFVAPQMPIDTQTNAQKQSQSPTEEEQQQAAQYLNEALQEVISKSGDKLPQNITIDENTIEDNPDSVEMTARLLIDGKPSDFSVTIFDQSLGARGGFDPVNMVKFYPREELDKWDWDLADRLAEEFNKTRTQESGLATVMDESDAVYFFNMQAALDFAEKARQEIAPTENRETSETKASQSNAAEIEIGGALVDRLSDMGLNVSTDLAANQKALKEAKADKSEAGTIHYFKTPSGKQYGFAYKGKVYLDPTKINAELPLHEYGHLWSEALRRLNPENWQRVVDTIKADKDAWEFVKSLRPELTDENEIAEEVIATFSGKNGAEKMRAEYDRMHGKDADYKSKWGNIFKNISKAIQDFWKAVGDFLNIKYESAEQVYDQVLKDFVDNMNPWKRVSDYLQARDKEYVQAAESGDIKTATNLFYDALKENIGNGITPYMSVGTYTQLKRLAKGVKTRNEVVIKEAAAKIAPLIPDNAVLIPAPSHDGRATDMLDLAKAVAEITGSEVADVLRSAPRESQYQAKKATGVPMASGQLGITMEGTLPEGKMPIIIDNVVDSGNTAEACVQAVGRAVVVTIGDSAEQYRHAASLKSAAPVLRDKAGKVIPLSKRFEPKGSRYLGRRMYLSSNDPRFAISGTQVIPVTDKTLVGLHNISAEKLRKALKMGGLANPSTAVIDIARQNHEQYGDISLIMPSSLVDSNKGRNAGTFTGDIWSPTYPHVEKQMSDKGDDAYYAAITKAFGDNEARKPVLSRAKLDFEDYLDSGNIRAGLAYWYLLEKGIEPGDVYFQSGISDDIKERFRPLYDKGILDLTKEDYRTLISLIAEQQGKTAEDMLQDAQESKARYQQTIDDPEAKQFYKKIAQQAIDEIDLYGVRYNILSNGYHQMERAIREDGKIDLTSTLIAAQDIVQTQHQADFDKWISDMDERFDISEVLFEDYDRDGNRIYKPHTLANVSRMMNKEDLQNAGDHGGLGATRGILVKRLETLADIRAEKGRLRPGTEEDIETEEWNKMQDEWFEKVLNPLSDMQKISDNPFSNVGYAETRLQEALRTKDPVAYLNKEYRYHIDKDSQWAKDLADMVERVKNLPTKYFETKFRRPVYLNEFANAVVPNDLPQDLRAGLESAGLRLFSYDPNTQGSRRDATLKATEADGIRFSINGNHRSSRGTMAGHNGMQSPVFADIKDQYLREMADIKDKAIKDSTFMQAPNGKPSRLNERQWLQVRTRAFKRWFGDWENDQENASKVLDENGEPMVVYHTSPNEFYIFDKSRIGEMFTGRPYDLGFYFTNDSEMSYGRNKFSVFLNIKDPLQISGDGWGSAISQTDKRTSDLRRWAKEQNNDGISVESMDEVLVENNSREFTDKVFVAFEPNQIKSATDNDGSFSESNDDIRFSISNQNNDIFYSNAERAVEGIKQEKATPEQWRAMIEKAGGLKAGEDKWIGLSDWLAQQRANIEVQPGDTRRAIADRVQKFTVSKEDILDYIRQNKIQIEETEYGETTPENNPTFRAFQDEVTEMWENVNRMQNGRFNEANQDIIRFEDDMQAKYGDDWRDLMDDSERNVANYLQERRDEINMEVFLPEEVVMEEMCNRHGDDFQLAFSIDDDGSLSIANEDAAGYYLDVNPINDTRLQYTTEGLQNKREIALTVPTIEAWNETDEIHFGDAGEGRAIAWVRFRDAYAKGDATIEQQKLFKELSKKYNCPPYALREKASKEDIERLDAVEAKINEEYKTNGYGKVLVIDEIQSKRHQEGREKGYRGEDIREKLVFAEGALNNFKARMWNKYVDKAKSRFEMASLMTEEEVAEGDRLVAEANRLRSQWEAERDAIPAAPFEKNWHELAMKRILRFAAENGYDKVAWTTGEQQAKRYDIGKEIDHIVKTDENTYEVYPTSGLMMTLEFDENGMYADEYDREYNGKSMSDIFGKDLAKRLKEMPVDETLQGDGLRVGYDGMKGFYDDILPRFMQKYGKKWGVQVGEVTMPDLEEGYQTMHAIDINDAMRESVMEGQPMFSISGRGVNGTIKPQDGETRSQYIARVAETVKNMTPRNSTIDDAIRFSITVNHNSPYLLKRADGAFVDPETGERLGFDHRFMGKGEGGQAHGWGSYFSVNDLQGYAVNRHGGDGILWNGKPLKDILENGMWDDAFHNIYMWVEDKESFKNVIRRVYIDGRIASPRSKRVKELNEQKRRLIDAIDNEEIIFPPKHHYTVAIPDNDGTNYFEEDQPLTQEQVDRLREQAKKDGILKDIKGFLYCCENLEDYPFRKFMSDITTTADIGGAGMTDKEASEFLSRAGFVGIHYDGRRDGECYVIFNPDDAVITDHIRFSVTSGKSVLPKTTDASQVEHPMRSTYNTNGDIVGDDQIRFSENVAKVATDAWNKYQYDGELESIRDVAEYIEDNMPKDKATAALFDAIDKWRAEEAEDRMLYGERGDLEPFEDAILNEIELLMKPDDQIRFSVNNPSTLSRSETVTKALVQQANNNYNIMQSALKKVTADLKGIRAAMRMQSDYDRKVVDALLNLYNTLLQENGVWAQYMPDTTRRIATQIVHAIGKQNITEEVNTIMDHMVHAQAKAAQRQWDKLRQTPIDKINISGVVMQGKVALEGQHALKAMNDALQANMTIEQIEEQINQLMDMEDNATDESLKTQYKGQWIGMTIAAQHLERLQHLQEERQQLDLELQSARSNKALKPAARQQLVDNIKQAMRDNYIEQAEAYTRSTQDLSEYVNTQEGRAKDFIRRQDANRDKIRSYAQRDLEGLATNPNRNRTRGNVARSIWDAFASPIRDLQSLLRLTGLHAPDGEGYLYNHFMRNWMDGADMERTGIVAASKTLDEKIAELTHGKYKTWEEAARKIDDASHNMFTITMLNGVDGKDIPVTEEIPLNAGNALYIYAVNKMNDGRMKLNGMNITEEDVQALADKVREQFGQEILDVVDWVQSEFFSQLRNRYNPTHEALFGAPMDAIENYFPLRINANARQQNEDLSEPDTDAARLLAGTSTGAIKRRTKNSLPLDVRNADFFQEVIRHVSQMERWNAFAQWNRDANILFSDINFRNRIKGMNGTIYGSGDKLYNYMKDAFRVAIGTYKPKTDTFSEITLNVAKGVTSAKINFRIWTAMKQIASFPAFFTYMQDGMFVGSYLRNWLKPHETMKWAKEHLPNFEKRVSKRDMGDMRLMQRTTDWQWNKRILEWSSKYGMFFNVFFDTLTCATGARAVYDSHLADYLKKGYSEEDARNRARQDAEQAFNTSQQSSEGAFMSAVQQDRNLVTAALTVFRTSPIQYTRNFMYHTRNLLRKFGEGKREEQIAFRMGQYKNDGLNDEQARKAAEKDYNKSLRQDIVGFVVYGALLNILWRLAGQIPYLLLGDDDDKKKQTLDDATSGGAWFSPFTGLLGGGIVESALDGNGSVADMFAPEMPFTQDIKRAGQYLSNNKYAEFASQALSVLMQSGTGFDPLTASDMISRIVTTLDSEEELDAATQALRVSQALLSIPQSQYEQMLIDKVASGETDEDAALEDYIRYQKIHTAPLTWWMRGEESDEKAEENAEKRFNKLLTERDKIKNPEDYEE